MLYFYILSPKYNCQKKEEDIAELLLSPYEESASVDAVEAVKKKPVAPVLTVTPENLHLARWYFYYKGQTMFNAQYL